jgi:TolB protein
MRLQGWLLWGGLLMGWSLSVSAMVNIEITQGSDMALPIAVLPFAGGEERRVQNIGSIIAADLRHSGRFKPLAAEQLPVLGEVFHPGLLKTWRGRGVDHVIRGKIREVGRNRFDIVCELLDIHKLYDAQKKESVVPGSPPSSGVIWERTVSDVSEQQLRRVAHRLSDQIFKELTGQKGYFSTWIAYVIVQADSDRASRLSYTLEVADYDGQQSHVLVKSKQPMMSPAWSPSGRQLAYVSFENQRSEIYIVDLPTGQRRLVSAYPGINGAPAFSPDGRMMAMTLSKDGLPHIYLLDLETHRLRQLTHGLSTDTEPSFHPNGHSLLFTSNRSGGKPNIFQMELTGSKAPVRLSYEGNYSARASYSPDGRSILFMHKGVENRYRIALQNLASGKIRVLTTAVDDESPSFSPGGNMVIYCTRGEKYISLGQVSTDGRIQWKLPVRGGRVLAPAWGPTTM